MINAPDPNDLDAILGRIRAQAGAEMIRVTQHAHQEMVQEDFLLDEVLQAFGSGQVLENYPLHRRGPCCLVGGTTTAGRPVHIVCTTGQPVLIIITVYEPKPPKWPTPTERSRRL